MDGEFRLELFCAQIWNLIVRAIKWTAFYGGRVCKVIDWCCQRNIMAGLSSMDSILLPYSPKDHHDICWWFFFKSQQMNIHAFNCFQLFKKQKLYWKGYIFDMRGKRELMHVKMLNVVVLLKKYSRTCLFSKSATTKPF